MEKTHRVTMRSLRLSSRKRRAHSPLHLHDEARLIIGAQGSSRNQQVQHQLRAPTLCIGTCRRATPATRRSPAHCTWLSIAPIAAKSTARWVSMPYSPTSGRAHSRNGAEHLRSPTPRPVYSSSSCTIPFMIPCALRACTWCAASPRDVQVRLVCHVSTSVPSVCLRACTCVSVNLDSDHSFK